MQTSVNIQKEQAIAVHCWKSEWMVIFHHDANWADGMPKIWPVFHCQSLLSIIVFNHNYITHAFSKFDSTIDEH